MMIAAPVTVIITQLFACDISAQSYPSRAVRVIVPFQAGGRLDLAMRIIGQFLAEKWGQPVVIDNRPGAGGNVGMAIAATASPDGYTLVSAANPMSANVTLYKNLPFDARTAFAPITLYYIDGNALVVSPSLPVESVADLVSLAKTTKGGITFASSGNGTSLHLSGELFKSKAGIPMTHVPYRGVPPAVADIIGRRVTMMFLGLSIATPYIQNGQLKGLAVTTTKRSAEATQPAHGGRKWLQRLRGFVFRQVYLHPREPPAHRNPSYHRDVVMALNNKETRAALDQYSI